MPRGMKVKGIVGREWKSMKKKLWKAWIVLILAVMTLVVGLFSGCSRDEEWGYFTIEFNNGSRGGVRSACRRAVISARVCGAIARLCLTNGGYIRYNSAEKNLSVIKRKREVWKEVF